MQQVARWCFDRNKTVIAIWAALVVGMGGLAAVAGGGFVDSFSLPGSESQKAYDQLAEKFPAASGDTSQVVFKATTGTLENKATKERVQALGKSLGGLPGVAAVVDPYRAPGALSKDRTIGFATLQFDKQASEIDRDQVAQVVETAQAAATRDLQVNLGGQAIKFAQQPEQSATEVIGVVAAIVVLVVVLGSFAAMSMPLIVAFSAIGVALSAVYASSALFDIATFAPTLAVMIALGVGIDYALLIINRFRGERRRGNELRAAAITALDTAGRSVLFAGTTVVIALLGMLLLGISFLNGPAIAAALAVFATMIGSLTLLPALLGTFGHRVKLGKGTGDPDANPGVWAKWARFIEKRPKIIAVVTLAVVAVIALPVFGMQLGSADSGSDAEGTTTRLAYDQLAEGFGPGFNGPFLVVNELPGAGDASGLKPIETAIAKVDGVAAVTPPILNPAKDTAIFTVYPASKPQASATQDLLSELRDDVIPPLERQTGITASVGGSTATTSDLNSALASKLPLFIAVVVGLSLLLLAIVFRSIVIPAKAAVMNVLSIGAALGVITFVFQDGHFASLLGVETTGPIEAFLPVFMFAIVFGLSMDYEVFLVSRMHEEWEKKQDPSGAVRNGLALTGKVVMAAAIIMVSVFGAFMLGDDRTIKLFGLGLASAVFVDAFIIRLILVPAVMFVLGKSSWYMPAGLARRLPRLSIEGPAEPTASQR